MSWFSSLSKTAQAAYLKKHPGSKFGKKSKSKVKNLDNSDSLSGYGRVLAIKASVRKEAGNFARRRKLYRQSKGAAW